MFFHIFFPSVFRGRWGSSANVPLPSPLLSSCKTLIGVGTASWLHSLIGSKKERKKKKTERKKRKSSFNSFCLSPPPHLRVFCEVEIGNAPQMHRGDILNRIEVPLPRRVKHSGAEKSPACSLSFNDCLISRSNLGFWLSGHFWCRRGEKRGEMGRDVITSLSRLRTDEELGSN